MYIAVELALLLGVLAIVGYPLLKRSDSGESAIAETELSDLLYKRDAIYTSLKDLEFDRATGKVDQKDYTDMKTRFRSEAVEILKKVDEAKESLQG